MARDDPESRRTLQRQLDRLSSLLVEEEKASPPPPPPPPAARRPPPPPPLHARLPYNPMIPAFLDPDPSLQLVEALLYHDSRMLNLPSARGSSFSSPDANDLATAVLESFNSYMAESARRTRPATAPPLPEATLVEQCVAAGGTESATCMICFEDLPVGCHHVLTSCCSTTESPKRLHYKCAVHCLRQDDRCPFCKSTRIAFA